ncbi:MAG: DUF3833 family protein [Thermomonas sp.]
MMKKLAITALLLAFNVVVAAVPVAGEVIEFTPQNGFSGDSEGHGSLKLLFGKARLFQVDSRGTQQADGTFRLEQTVTFQGEPATARVWHLTTTGAHHYSATLSDAAGPVSGTSTGPHLSLEYRIKGPLVMHQELELMQDGRTIDNIGTVTLLGIAIGHLHETITRKSTAHMHNDASNASGSTARRGPA